MPRSNCSFRSSRIEKLRRKLEERGIEALLISGAESRLYLSGFKGSAGFLLITQDKALIAVDPRYTEQAKREAPHFELFPFRGKISAWFRQFIENLHLKKLGFEAEFLSFAEYEEIQKSIQELPVEERPSLEPVRGIVLELRAVKDEEEVEKIRRALALARRALDLASELIKPGRTEREIAWELEKFLREEGSEPLPFPIIVASGPNAALPHASPTFKAIREGEPVVVDLGARIEGYCSDLTRTFIMGRNPEFEEILNIVKRAQIAALEGMRAGMKGREVDALARRVIEEAGFGEHFGHGLGHGVGLAVHEKPVLSRESEDILLPGMIFTIEPGIYIPGKGGARVEDMVLLGEEGPILL